MEELLQVLTTPDTKEEKLMWREGVFAFDANILLVLYKLSEPARSNLFSALELVQDQAWLPYHAAMEYLYQRERVIKDLSQSYDVVKNQLKGLLRSYHAHPCIRDERIKQAMREASKLIKKSINDSSLDHPFIKGEDTIVQRLAEIFRSKVGEPYTRDEMERIFHLADRRIAMEMPPGYMDDYKLGDSKYGDVVVWYQLIDHARDTGRPLILVTNDGKRDWWLNGAPRPELIQEMRKEAGVPFHMYHGYEFLEMTSKIYGLELWNGALSELRYVVRTTHDGGVCGKGYKKGSEKEYGFYDEQKH